MRYLVLLLSAWGAVSYVRSRRKRARASQPLLLSPPSEPARPHVVYRIVEHDGGWAYRVRDVFSESYPTRRGAVIAANSAAEAHEQSGLSAHIEYQDANGNWHEEDESGEDRPDTDVAADVERQNIASR